MKRARIMRSMCLFCSGALILQATGCFTTGLEVLQTGLLGVTAAGAIAIIQNI